MVKQHDDLNKIENEIMIGLTGSLGVDFDEVAKVVAKQLSHAGYHVEIIRIAENFAERAHPSKFARCYWKMQYGTKQRHQYGNDYWARRAVESVFQLRRKACVGHRKIAYLIRSLKNKQEIELLADIYGRNFISIAVFSDSETSVKYLRKKLALSRISVAKAAQQMCEINYELDLSDDVELSGHNDLYISDVDDSAASKDSDTLAKFLLSKDQVETHLELKKYGQNFFTCYSSANYFVYQNKNLSAQIARFVDLLFNDPFAEPTVEEYFMFCAQAAAYRSLDLDRQVGAVIVNRENELVASGFNDVCKVGGGHFAQHGHPLSAADLKLDQRDYTKDVDFNHNQLDQIATRIAHKLNLKPASQVLLREELSSVTEFKRSTHAEMSALLDASRRGVAVRDCTIYVNTYPCHNCTKHLIASGIRRIVFLHPYTKSKARQMYSGMLRHGLSLSDEERSTALVFEPFLGVSPNRFIYSFSHDKTTRLEQIDGKETGRPAKWRLTRDAIPTKLKPRLPFSYISREWAAIYKQNPDISCFYDE